MIHGLSNMGNNNQQEKSWVDKIKDFWSAIPFFANSIICITLFLYLLSFFVNLQFLVSQPSATVYKLRIWTLVTSSLVTLSIINVIFAFMSWVPSAIKEELELGSVAYLLNFLQFTILIQVIYTGAMFLMKLIGFGQVIEFPSTGIWPFIMAEITIKCMKNPNDQMTFFMFPCPIKAMYYPWFLICFFTMFNGFQVIPFDLITAVLFGYLYIWKLNSYFNYSIQKIQSLESKFPFSYLKKFHNFILLTNSSGSTGFTASSIVASPNQSAATPQPKPTYEVIKLIKLKD